MDKDAKRRIATVGSFDGLHRGHQRVLSLLKETARSRGWQPLVVCFDRHPLETIAPERAPLMIQAPSERTNTLYRDGFSILTVEFTPQLASLTAHEWLARLHDEQDVDAIVVGYDNTFGSDGLSMNIADYRRIGREVGVEVIEAPYEPHASSSAIRKLLKNGDIEEANNLLGRPFSLNGKVEEGKHLGETIGFPTANISTAQRQLLPKAGVYEVEVMQTDEPGSSPAWRKGVANIGRQPTVGAGEPVRVEVHIPGFTGDLYGKRLTIRFLKRLRDEKKFDSIEELKAQIKEDVKTIERR